MIWNNPGHELDELGSEYTKVRSIFLFGFDEETKNIYTFLKWLKIDTDFNIQFIWDETEHEDKPVPDEFLGKKVIVYNSNSKLNSIPDFEKTGVDETVIVLKHRDQTRRLERIRNMGFKKIFFMRPSNTGRDNFVQNFICIYMMYKYGKLVSHWTNYLVTFKCDLHCKYCLNYNDFLPEHKDVAMDAFKTHFKILFDKFDYLYSLHFCGGEPLMTSDLAEKIEFLKQYRDRIYDFFIITNGTIIPSEKVLAALKDIGASVFIDDYSESVKQSKIDSITDKFDEYGINYWVVKAPYWFNLAIDSTYEEQSDQELEQHKDHCNSYLHEFADGKIYACCYQEYAHRAGKESIDAGDYISMKDKSKMEILEFRQGYSLNGYTSLCKRCKGIGDQAIKVPAAEQREWKKGMD